MHRNSPERERSPARFAWQVLIALFLAVGFSVHGMAQAPAPASAAGAPPPMSAEDLDNLVGRIALYPDDLVAIILPASTNPLQLVQADRFLDKRKADPNLPVDDKWDDSVKALLNYPDVVKMMSADLDWTSALGEAVVADQGAVLEAIQAFRRKAQAVGNLNSNDKQVVTVEKQVITIVPANPEVIYVPQYNPTTVIVTPGYAWGYWPTPYPVYYYPYPPGAAFATGLIWGAAIGAAWNGGHWNTNWGGGDININRNTNINTGNINRGNVNTGNINRPGTLPAPGSGTAWKPDKKPGQVSGTVGRTSTTARVGDARPGGAASTGGLGGAGGTRTSPSTGSLGAAGANRPSTQPSGGGSAAANRAGSVSASPRDNFGGSSAFGGYGSGRQTQMDSSRGASSRGSMSGASRSMPSGGARGGGGRGGGRR
jgi:Protein of unknown function (DUF3300)